jgi:hypothetical protein
MSKTISGLVSEKARTRTGSAGIRYPVSSIRSHPSRASRRESGRLGDKGRLTNVTLRDICFDETDSLERRAPPQNDVRLRLSKPG